MTNECCGKCKKKLTQEQVEELIRLGVKKECEIEILKDITKFKMMKELIKGNGSFPSYIG